MTNLISSYQNFNYHYPGPDIHVPYHQQTTQGVGVTRLIQPPVKMPHVIAIMSPRCKKGVAAGGSSSRSTNGYIDPAVRLKAMLGIGYSNNYTTFNTPPSTPLTQYIIGATESPPQELLMKPVILPTPTAAGTSRYDNGYFTSRTDVMDNSPINTSRYQSEVKQQKNRPKMASNRHNKLGSQVYYYNKKKRKPYRYTNHQFDAKANNRNNPLTPAGNSGSPSSYGKRDSGVVNEPVGLMKLPFKVTWPRRPTLEEVTDISRALHV